MAEVEQWLRRQWTEALAQALAAMSGDPVAAEPDGDPAAPDAAGLIWSQPVAPLPHAQVWVHTPEAVWRTVGRRILTVAGLDEAGDEEIRGTWLESLQQSLSSLASAFGARIGQELHCPPGEIQATAPPGGQWWPARLDAPGVEGVRLFICFSPEILAALETPAAPAAEAPVREVEASGPSLPPGVTESKTLGLLLEVEMPVSVSFGRTQMRVKDVIKLTTGSIVELKQNVSEPVDVIVNNCVIARGEVVVVEGNYGVRVRHIISQQERLRTLF